jgi:uroporphyrinogen decarboxylase
MRPDKMTSKERTEALLKGKPVDHVGFYPFVLGFCAKNVGYPVSAMYSDPQKSFDAQLWTHEQYGFDWGPIYGYASYGAWEFGGKVKMPESTYEQAPAHLSFPVQCEDDVDKLKLPEITQAGCIPLAMEFSKLQAKHKTTISVTFGSNFTIAGNICPVETLCRWMIKEPDLAHRILRLATDHITDIVKYWADTFGGENVVPQIWEPLESNDIISPPHFEKFVLPYLQETGEKILSMGIKHIFHHICGEHNANMHYWTQVPMGDPGICSIGKDIEINTAIEHLGDRAIIAGNIEPNILLTATPQEVYELCRGMVEEGKKAPRGFMLMSGCETPPNTSPYNVYMMRKAIIDHGWYDTA